MAPRICILLRHGDYHQLPGTPSAHQPFPLTADGEQQAAESIPLVRSMVDSHGWHLHPVVHSSNLLRAWQTAQILAHGLAEDLQVTGTDLLAERGLGSGANLSTSQLREVLLRDPRCGPVPENWKADSHFRLPLMGAESLMEAGGRVADYISSAMRDLPESESGAAVLFVGHGAAFRHAAHLLGAIEFDEIARLSMFHAQPVALADAGGGRWTHAAGNWKIRPQSDSELD